jgi:ABC-type transport system involved in cytochrome bd biosynthesis fused ATPase/permease subunit
MLRRQFLTTVAALALASCTNPTTGEVTVGDIVKWLQDNCSFTTSVQMVTAVVAAVVAGFNAAAGAAAVIAANVAKQIEDQICNAVKAHVAESAKLKAAAKGATEHITVVVNGVEVTGIYVAK